MDKVGIISRVECLGVSAYGNPYYRVYFEDGSNARTSIDSVVNYGIENSDIRGVKVSIKLTKAGRICCIKKVEPTEESVTIWVCVDCIAHHANGECGSCYDDHGHDEEPLGLLVSASTAMGMAQEGHACGRQDDTHFGECDCETRTYNISRCEGCGSWLHGVRHAMTIWL